MTNETFGLYSQCSLEESLIMTHNLTSEPRCAADLLLQRMNDVLRAAVGSNFNSNCSHPIDSLYESIDLHQPGMISRSEDMPLLYFARSFAVVFGEAMSRLHQPHTDIVAVLHSVSFTTSDQDSKHFDILREEQFEKKEETKDLRSNVFLEKEETKEEEPERKVTMPAAAATAAVATAAPAALETNQLQQSAAAAQLAVAPRPGLGNKLLQHPTKNNILCDFSPEAIEGRIIIFDVPLCVSKEWIRAILRPFGQLLTFSYSTTKNGGMAFAKLESNEAANAAVKALNVIKLGGVFVRATRAEYWSRYRDECPQDDHATRDIPSPRFGFFKEHPLAAAAATATTVDCAADVMIDSDDETEEVRENLSNSSFFSVD